MMLFITATASLVAGKTSACNAGDLGLIPGSGRSLEKEMATHSSILAWRIPWTEEPGGLQSGGHKESDTTELVHFHFHHSNRLKNNNHMIISTDAEKDFPSGPVAKNPPASVGDTSSIPALG